MYHHHYCYCCNNRITVWVHHTRLSVGRRRRRRRVNYLISIEWKVREKRKRKRERNVKENTFIVLQLVFSLHTLGYVSDSDISWAQCDQMARLFVQYLPIFNKLIYPIAWKIRQSMFNILPNTKLLKTNASLNPHCNLKWQLLGHQWSWIRTPAVSMNVSIVGTVFRLKLEVTGLTLRLNSAFTIIVCEMFLNLDALSDVWSLWKAFVLKRQKRVERRRSKIPCRAKTGVEKRHFQINFKNFLFRMFDNIVIKM